MKSKKLGTIFLSMLLVFTLLIAVGCGKDEEKPAEDKNKPAETDKKEENNNKDTSKTDNSSNTTKTVKLLKRNGVEWKENTRINSKRGAKSYKVVWGDTLSLIARTWHVNCYKLANYNGIKNIDLIEVDQIIYNYAAK